MVKEVSEVTSTARPLSKHEMQTNTSHTFSPKL